MTEEYININKLKEYWNKTYPNNQLVEDAEEDQIEKE